MHEDDRPRCRSAHDPTGDLIRGKVFPAQGVDGPHQFVAVPDPGGVEVHADVTVAVERPVNDRCLSVRLTTWCPSVTIRRASVGLARTQAPVSPKVARTCRDLSRFSTWAVFPAPEPASKVSAITRRLVCPRQITSAAAGEGRGVLARGAVGGSRGHGAAEEEALNCVTPPHLKPLLLDRLGHPSAMTLMLSAWARAISPSDRVSDLGFVPIPATKQVPSATGRKAAGALGQLGVLVGGRAVGAQDGELVSPQPCRRSSSRSGR